MRFSITVLVLLALCLPYTCHADNSGKEALLKKRELLATYYFEVNSDKLSHEQYESIKELLPKVRALQNEGRLIRVEGYASPDGDSATNLRISIYRAWRVAEFIESQGLPAEITMTGFGDLMVSGGSLSSERRVEVVAYETPENFNKLPVEEKPEKVKKAKVRPASAPSRQDAAAVARKKAVIDAEVVEQAIKEKVGKDPVTTK